MVDEEMKKTKSSCTAVCLLCGVLEEVQEHIHPSRYIGVCESRGTLAHLIKRAVRMLKGITTKRDMVHQRRDGELCYVSYVVVKHLFVERLFTSALHLQVQRSRGGAATRCNATRVAPVYYCQTKFSFLIFLEYRCSN